MPYFDMNQPWVYMCSPSWTSLLVPSRSHSSRTSQCTSPEHPVSYIKPGLAIYFTYGNIHVSMLFSQIIPPLSSPRVQKSVLYICVSFAVSPIGSSLPSFKEESWEPSLSKEIKPVNLKGNQPWILIGRTDAEAEAPILWLPDANNPTHWKKPWCWKSEGRRRRKRQRMR